MTTSTYREKKMVRKFLTDVNIRQIAREEKVCPETVRKILEKNWGETGYQRGRSFQKMLGKDEYDRRVQYDCVLPSPSRSAYDYGIFGTDYGENTYDSTYGFVAKDTDFNQPQNIQTNDDLKKVHDVLDQFLQRMTAIETSMSSWKIYLEEQKNINESVNNIVKDIQGLQKNQGQMQQIINTIQSEVTGIASPINLHKELLLMISTCQRDINYLKVIIPVQIKNGLQNWSNEQNKIFLDTLVESQRLSQPTQNSFSQKNNPRGDLLKNKDNKSFNKDLIVLAGMGLIKGLPKAIKTIDSSIHPKNTYQWLIPIDKKR